MAQRGRPRKNLTSDTLRFTAQAVEDTAVNDATAEAADLREKLETASIKLSDAEKKIRILTEAISSLIVLLKQRPDSAYIYWPRRVEEITRLEQELSLGE